MTDDDELRDAIYRLIQRATCATGMPIPGSREWWDAPVPAQLAAVAVLGQQYLYGIDHPLKEAAVSISTGLDWCSTAHHLVYETPEVVAARRATPVTPARCTHGGCRAVISVAHPLPDLRRVRCSNHRDTAAAA